MTETSSPARSRRDFALFAFIAIGVMAAYVAIELGMIDGWDGQSMASVAQNLAQHLSLKECCRAYGAFPLDKGAYAKFGIGYSLALVPFEHLQSHGANPPRAVWLGLANPLLLTATTLVILRTGLVLGWRRSSAALAALAFALLTMAPLYSTEFFSEPGVALGISLSILGFVTWTQQSARGPLLVGFGTAFAILFRPDSIIMLGPVVALMLFFRGRDSLLASRRSWLPALGVPIGLAVAWTLYYNWLRYGKPFQVGYNGHYDSRGFNTPLLKGIALLVWSPGKSFFVYSPILLAALPGLVWLWRRRRNLVVVIGTMCVVRILFYARWWTPEGGNSWGPRFLLPLCAVLAIPLGETFEHLHTLGTRVRRIAIAGVAALALASFVVQMSSLLVSYRDIFPAINALNTPTSTPSAAYRRRLYTYGWTWGGNHISWNLAHIGSRSVHSPLYWFHGGPSPFGVSMVALAIIMCAAAIAIAILSDRIENTKSG